MRHNEVVHDTLPVPLVDLEVLLLLSVVVLNVMLPATVVLLNEVFARLVDDRVVTFLNVTRLAPEVLLKDVVSITLHSPVVDVRIVQLLPVVLPVSEAPLGVVILAFLLIYFVDDADPGSQLVMLLGVVLLVPEELPCIFDSGHTPVVAAFVIVVAGVGEALFAMRGQVG